MTMIRKIPTLSLTDFETKAKKKQIYQSMVENKTLGVEYDLDIINVAEIKDRGIIISVPKKEWKGGLENAMDYYIKREEYEICSKIKKLIKKL